MSRRPITKEVQYSKALSYLLRHGAVKEGVAITHDGYVKLEDILANKSFRGASKDDILRIVENCPKQRFALRQDNNQIWLRAAQGHTMNNVELDLKEILDPNELTNCIHGTYHQHWNSIRRDGLSRMKRHHIHCSEDFPGSDKVISGMRTSCQIAVYVNVKRALEDGIKFYRSENNVILTPGDENGFLKPIYFQKAVDLKTNELLDI